MNIAITIPKTTTWETYEKELIKAESGDILNYRLGHIKPKRLNPGDRCYLVHDGLIRGYHIVIDVVWKSSFHCSTTGKIWIEGYYVRRTGQFIKIPPIKMNGFQGFRYYSEPENSFPRGLS
jgi:hypothetical protein